MKKYAYGISVGGQKKQVGTISATSMEDAVLQIATSNRMRMLRKPSVIRPCDGAVIPQAEWVFRGRKAEIYVWSRPEDFSTIPDFDPQEIPT